MKPRAQSETEKEKEPEKSSLFSKIGRFFGGVGSKEKLDCKEKIEHKQQSAAPNNRLTSST